MPSREGDGARARLIGQSAPTRYLFALDDIEVLIRRAEEIRREDLYTVRLRR